MKALLGLLALAFVAFLVLHELFWQLTTSDQCKWENSHYGEMYSPECQ